MATPRHGREPAGRFRRRRVLTAVGLVVVLVVAWVGISVGSFIANPAYGTSVSARLAEWAREHGAGGMVTSIEQWWYSHHPPATGGQPSKGTIPTGQGVVAMAGHLPAPPPVVPPASPPLPGEGVWHPVGRSVDGSPAILRSVVRVDAVHTGYVAAIAWMDTSLLKPTLYSGSFIPGGGPYHYSAPISARAATTLVSAFNAGFRMQDANGGYYTDGRMVLPLRNGAASFVIYKSGSSTVGKWGRDVTMNPAVAQVRQNLDLIVDGGRPAPGLSNSANTNWGATLGGGVYVWRSGLGVTKTGALVYVGGPALSITSLADLLIRAGAIRAMELDINTDWVQYSTFAYPPGGAASAANGTPLLSSMVSSPARYFESWFNRDFLTMSARPTPVPVKAPN